MVLGESTYGSWRPSKAQIVLFLGMLGRTWQFLQLPKKTLNVLSNKEKGRIIRLPF
jgi:protein-S-isoprenylcysteine O-methyltransferase Ste14